MGNSQTKGGAKEKQEKGPKNLQASNRPLADIAQLRTTALKHKDPMARLPNELFLLLLGTFDPKTYKASINVSRYWNVVGLTPHLWLPRCNNRTLADEKLAVLIRYYATEIWELSSCSKLTDRSLKNLETIPRITVLHMNNTKFSDQAYESLLKSCGGTLETLKMKQCCLDPAVISTHCKVLKKLNLRHYKYQNVERFSELSTLTTLTDLDVLQRSFFPAQKMLQPLSPNLINLTFNHNPEEPLPHMPMLRTLFLRSSDAISSLNNNFPNLVDLSIHYFSPSKQKELFELLSTQFQDLERLDLGSPDDSQSSIPYLTFEVFLNGFKKLKVCRICGWWIDNAPSLDPTTAVEFQIRGLTQSQRFKMVYLERNKDRIPPLDIRA